MVEPPEAVHTPSITLVVSSIVSPVLGIEMVIPFGMNVAQAPQNADRAAGPLVLPAAKCCTLTPPPVTGVPVRVVLIRMIDGTREGYRYAGHGHLLDPAVRGR